MGLNCNIKLLAITLNENRHTSVKIFNFDTQVYNKFHASRIKTYLKNKPKKGLIVSLRAPKHFKVGRQQFNTWNQLVRTTFTPDSDSCSMNYSHCNKFIASTNKAIIKGLPFTALASVSTIKITHQVSFTFIIV